jgi:hypothetical protein
VARTRPCTPEVRAGRLRKAGQFADAAATVAELADEAGDVADAYVTLLIRAGIAAADVICCARLGEHAQTDSHQEAVALLKKADPGSARALEILLKMKTRIEYGHTPASAEDQKRAQRAADGLVRTARAVL